MHVCHVGAGTNIFESKLLQTTTVATAHAAAATRGRGDQLGERTVINRGKELVQGLADVDQKLEIDAQLFEVLEGTHLGAAKDFFSALKKLRQLGGVQSLGLLMSCSSFLRSGEVCPVPRRVIGAVTEFTEGSSLDQAGCGLGA